MILIGDVSQDITDVRPTSTSSIGVGGVATYCYKLAARQITNHGSI
jgi:hypothetical protein